MTEITFTDAALGDLRRIGPDTAPQVLKEVLLLLDRPAAGYPLGGGATGYRKLAVGRNTWCAVYRIAEGGAAEICEVRAVGARADDEVYAEAMTRALESGGRRPEFHELVKAIERLGRLTGDIAPTRPTTREPVPDWLAERLVHTAGMTPEAVAALGLEEAVDHWTDFASRQRPDRPVRLPSMSRTFPARG